jgi:hypothetical protein
VDRALTAAVEADSLFSDSIRRANQLPVDTIPVGPLRIVTLPGQQELAREVFQEAWTSFSPLVRGSEHVLSDHLFVFRYGWRTGGMYLDGEKIHNVEMSRRWGMSRLQQKVRRGLGEALRDALPPDSSGLARWVGDLPLTPPEDWSWIYRELAATPSMVVRECYEGELPMCWEALGLTETEDGWLTWYSPEERRLLVEDRWSHRPFLGGVLLEGPDLILHGCLELASDAACIQILSEWPGRIPLETPSRASIVAEALTQGGEGAFPRLIADPGASIKERLAHAAGLPADTLVARWRVKVLESGPATQGDLFRSPFSLAFWLALLFFLATRSTSRRLG